MDIERIKQIGVGAAYRAGEVLKKHFGKLDGVKKKGQIDLVTAADIESERTIVETIRSAFPEHTILAEEGGLLKGQSDNCWIIDPLDGTTNFAHNLNIFSVSIAFSHKQKTRLGIVFNPISGELFTAVENQGAQLNNGKIQVSTTPAINESLLVTGFPYNLHSIIDRLMKRIENTLCATQGIRRLGSAALDLCYLACGRFDGFWEENLNPWDTAAGALIAAEAGAKITNFDGQPFNCEMKQILATNGHIHTELLALLTIKDNE